MRVCIGILLCKLITWVCKVFKKKGTVFPGLIIHDYWDKNILKKIKLPKTVIAVTGSSGKGSTTEAIAHILKTSGKDFVFNKDDSNGILAAITLVLNNCNFKGEFKHDILLMECDERHLKLMFDKGSVSHLVITNITRDQPTRHGNSTNVFNDIVKVIDKNTSLVLNADDSYLITLKYKYQNVTTFGIDRTGDSFSEHTLNAVDNQYCPSCHKKLFYDFYHYAHLGSYRCEYCNFQRGSVDYLVSDVDLEKQSILVNGEMFRINMDVLYAAYSTVASIALAETLGISREEVLRAINVDRMVMKRGQSYRLGKREFHILESKNENAPSYYQSLKYVAKKKERKTVILGFEHVSLRYKYSDISWLYDIEFELINDESVDKVLCIGKFKYDVATRLEYAGIASNKIILVEDMDRIIDILKEETEGTIYLMACFYMTYIIKDLLGKEEGFND